MKQVERVAMSLCATEDGDPPCAKPCELCLRQAHTAIAAMWDDIENAPRDGTEILLALFAHQHMQWACKGSFVSRIGNEIEDWYGSDGRLRSPTHYQEITGESE